MEREKGLMVDKRDFIIEEFKAKIIATFGNDLNFAFLCGSFAANKSTDKSDIDMFVCLRKRNKNAERFFLKWYLLVHEKSGYTSDSIYKYEVCSRDELRFYLDLAAKEIPTTKVNFPDLYSGIVLAGMLSGDKAGLIGSHEEYLFFRKKAQIITKKWMRHIINSFLKLKADDFLKRIIVYEKNGR